MPLAKILDPAGMGRALCVDPEAASKKEIMTRKIYETNANHGPEYNKILINHWRWLESQGPSYKQQAASAKLQAASLTRKLYRSIKDYAKKEKNKTKTNN